MKEGILDLLFRKMNENRAFVLFLFGLIALAFAGLGWELSNCE